MTVKVVNSNGNPQHYARVAISVSQCGGSGNAPERYTDSIGAARFSLDIDDSAQITVYVNGNKKVLQSPVRSEYFVTI
jgi:hypothetical protein